jgi:hypothetical protein
VEKLPHGTKRCVENPVKKIISVGTKRPVGNPVKRG